MCKIEFKKLLSTRETNKESISNFLVENRFQATLHIVSRKILFTKILGVTCVVLRELHFQLKFADWFLISLVHSINFNTDRRTRKRESKSQSADSSELTANLEILMV